MNRRERDNVNPVRLAGMFFRVSAMNELQYRVEFFVHLGQTVVWTGMNLAVLAMLFSHTNDLHGWTRPELTVVVGVFTLMNGIIQMLIEPNMQRVLQEVHDGTFDYALTKPVDSQLISSIRVAHVWSVTDIAVGAVLVGAGVSRGAGPGGIGALLAFIALIALGAVLIYCFWLVLISGAFWFVRMDQIVELWNGLYRAGQYPIGVYPIWLRFGLTFLVPLGLAITIPAEALTGRLTMGSLVVALVATALIVVASRALWVAAVRHYSGASA